MPSSASVNCEMLRNEDDMLGMSLGTFRKYCGRSPTQFYEPSAMPSVAPAQPALKRALIPEFDAAQGQDVDLPDAPAGKGLHGTCFSPAAAMEGLASEVLGPETSDGLTRKDQNALKAAKKKKAQEKAMAKSKGKAVSSEAPVHEDHDEMGEEEEDMEPEVPNPKKTRKPKAKAKANPKPKCKAAATPKGGRGSGRARGRGRGRGQSHEVETPEHRGPAVPEVPEETPPGAADKQPIRKRKAGDKPPALAKKVKGLPTEQREECKKFLTCKYIECPLISPHVRNALSWQELGVWGMCV